MMRNNILAEIEEISAIARYELSKFRAKCREKGSAKNSKIIPIQYLNLINIFFKKNLNKYQKKKKEKERDLFFFLYRKSAL